MSTIHQSLVQPPVDSFDLFDLEVTMHLAKAQLELQSLRVYGVRLQAETSVDERGNRSARVFPLRRPLVDGRLGEWDRVEAGSYHAAGIYVSFTRTAPDPAWTAKLAADVVKKADELLANASL